MLSTKAEQHSEICKILNTIYKNKNEDYGDSFSDSFKDYGFIMSVVRIEDKMRRYKRLINNQAQVKEETIRDTLMDMANYCIMTVMELDKIDKIGEIYAAKL